MATLLLTAAVAATNLSGATLFLASAAATAIGTFIDSRLFGPGDSRQQGNRIEEISLSTSSEGQAVKRLYGRTRLSSNLIWITNFIEEELVTEQRGRGKGTSGSSETVDFLYSVSFAVAFTEGNEHTTLGRIWADNRLLDTNNITYRFYPGSLTQRKDPKIVSVEGSQNTSAYRGICYMVFEDLELSDFGNRIPQITAEITVRLFESSDLINLLQSVNLIPGFGEAVYGTTPQISDDGFGNSSAENIHLASDKTNMEISTDGLRGSLPLTRNVCISVPWYGTDLRAPQCRVEPRLRVIRNKTLGPIPWKVSHHTRSNTNQITSPVFGSTPSDHSVVEAIQYLCDERNLNVFFCPYTLMDIPENNGLPDPYGSTEQQAYPWRGLITTDPANSTSNFTQVSDFFRTPATSSFTISGTTVTYTGTNDSFGIMILHYAHLCAAAANTLDDPTKFKAFYIGSELKDLTELGISLFTNLLARVRTIFNNAGLTHVELSYAAHWTEYNNVRSGNQVRFHLDPLWANCSFVGINNYLPISDWREGTAHEDYGSRVDRYRNRKAVSIYDQDYLKDQIEGGEYYDYLYASESDRVSQTRTDLNNLDLSSLFTVPALLPPGGEQSPVSISRITLNAAFSASIVLPEQPVDAYIWYHGNSYLGVINNGQTFRLRVGNPQTIDDRTLVLDIPTVDMPFDGRVHELIWQIVPNPGMVVLWINDIYYGADDGPRIFNNTWTSETAMGYYLRANPPVPAFDFVEESFELWPVTQGASNLRYQLRFDFPRDIRNNVNTNWPYRQKDIRGWWSNAHHNIVAGVRETDSTDWVPRSKRIVFSEFGCGAINKGTNRPDKNFPVPFFSTESRDDRIQRSYYQAMVNYWRDNSPSGMVDPTDMFAYGWDPRPYPIFPFRSDLFVDGQGYSTSHWLNGRIDNVFLEELVRVICAWVGLEDQDLDLTDLENINVSLTGYPINTLASPREALSPLFSAFLFDGFESQDKIKFLTRRNISLSSINTDDLAITDEETSGYKLTRTQETELPAKSSLSYTSEQNDYQSATVGAQRQTTSSEVVIELRFPLVLSREFVEILSTVVIQESWTAREEINLTLPPSKIALDPGDGITFRDNIFRISEIQRGDTLGVSAQGVDPTLYDFVTSANLDNSIGTIPNFGRTVLIVMDLPLLSGEETHPWAPRLAAYQRPFPPAVNVFENTGSDLILKNHIQVVSQIGRLTAPLDIADHHIIDERNIVEIAVNNPNFQVLSDTEHNVRNGANAIAIQTTSGDWEIIKYVNSVFQSNHNYRLSRLFRGQLGTYAVMEDRIPAGQPIVFLGGNTIAPLEIAESRRTETINYRYGPSVYATGSNFYQPVTHTGRATGQIPYPVANLSGGALPTGILFTWNRQARFGGEDFEQNTVPFTEDTLQYQIDLLTMQNMVVNTVTQSLESWLYSGNLTMFKVRVRQISQSVGPGRPSTITWGT